MKIIKDNNNILLVLKEQESIEDKLIKSNTVDASFEKHVPQFNRIDNKLEVYVNHVMEEDHYIEWILVDYEDKQIIKHFSPGDEPKVTVDYQENITAYSYCNKHSLWSSKVNESTN